MIKKKHTEVIAVFLAIVVLVGFLTGYLVMRKRAGSGESQISVFYYDPIAKELVPETHEVPGEGVFKYFKTFDLLKTPDQKNLFPVVTDDSSITQAVLNEGILNIDIRADEYKLSLLGLKKEYAFVYGIVNTYTQFPEVDLVKITINGKNRDVLSHYADISGPLEKLSSNLPQAMEINIFFPTKDFEYAAVERRECLYVEDPQKRCETILKELCSGSRCGLYSLYDCSMFSGITLKTGGIASVNLKRESLPKGFGTSLENLFFSCIVNSLTELPDVEKVEFLVDGDFVDTLFGGIYLKEPLRRFPTAPSDRIVSYFYISTGTCEVYVPVVSESEKKNAEIILEGLKKKNGVLETKISKEASIASFAAEGRILSVSISLGYVPPATDLDIIKRQIALTFTENFDFDTIKLNIGEETFVVRR